MASVNPSTEWTGITENSNKSMTDIRNEKADFLECLSKEERRNRLNGEFWNSMDDVWDTYDYRITGNELLSISRPEVLNSCYAACYLHVASCDIRGSTLGTSSSRSTIINTNNNLQLDAFAYGCIAEAAVGKVVANAEERLKILRGVKNVDNSSLTSHKYNKMFLKGQKDFYDTNPSILVVPILSLDEVMKWAGCSTRDKDEDGYEVLAITFGDNYKNPSAEVLQYALSECSVNEIEVASLLLEHFLTGIACSIVLQDVFCFFSEDDLKKKSLVEWKRTVEDLVIKKIIKIPKEARRGDLHVAKGRVSIGNSLPDPWLVAMKAAINYSSCMQQKLMPACAFSNLDSDSEDDDYDDDSVIRTPDLFPPPGFDDCATSQDHKLDNLCGRNIEFHVLDIDNEDNDLDLEDLSCDF